MRLSNKVGESQEGLENAILEKIAAICEGGDAVCGMIHGMMRDQANASDPT